ncbi:hypothetical protein MJO28_003225 [Puccinia striiformis f. sp. tritici]|uniref:Uncharacterized protein n=2 Tax=Puccinia striiformis f. sp. tritici TaxID=168172 RepID=A0A0L0UY89_9BASI|nr:hypothetical protein Pst134EA_004867 [Puccinia striiformis f. sp. tritici]KNE92003.1 hypothetical protein PSTG_14593 [Puccinia striiformis f. sp. tritici PST-78]KAH9462033.1 hypothetical protein Pst134EB_005950 [Puccinia striiformis f. sp. tritici]KAH9470956.1 hypothetical protein Pst134EA_004867 [Puccinia striiformis f. sp. tritici]KAI7959434.1 hypothetical protein MJO28_003225 [Puccinia striiformis f. sp. tritici]KAI7965189.1 hypothetical protein MJO29_003287 [Puccinia striiformis f. sp. 
MTVNKFIAGQRKRRVDASEKQQQSTQSTGPKHIKAKKRAKTQIKTVIIKSDSDKLGVPIPLDDSGDTPDEPIFVEDDELSGLQQEVLKERNQANDVVQLLSSLYNDIDSDLDDDGDKDRDKITNVDEIFQSLWPLFHNKRDHTSAPNTALATGGSG